jgi:hypothetical protein
MKVLVQIFIIIFCFVIFSSNIYAQVVINEFSSSSSNNDWIELHNNSDNEINLKGYVIDDTASSDVKDFSEDLFMPAQAYCVFDVGNRLNKNGDVIRLLKGETQKDCVDYGDGNKDKCGKEIILGKILDNQFGARVPDGEGDWKVVDKSTQGYSNNETIEPASKISCYTATPTPTLSPKPTKSPTSEPTADPTLSTQSGTSGQATSTPEIEKVTNKPEVLSVEVNKKSETPEASVSAVTDNNKNMPLTAYGLILAGIGCIGIAIFPFAKQYWEHYNNKHKEGLIYEKTSESVDSDNRFS